MQSTHRQRFRAEELETQGDSKKRKQTKTQKKKLEEIVESGFYIICAIKSDINSQNNLLDRYIEHIKAGHYQNGIRTDKGCALLVHNGVPYSLCNELGEFYIPTYLHSTHTIESLKELTNDYLKLYLVSCDQKKSNILLQGQYPDYNIQYYNGKPYSQCQEHSKKLRDFSNSAQENNNQWSIYGLGNNIAKDDLPKITSENIHGYSGKSKFKPSDYPDFEQIKDNIQAAFFDQEPGKEASTMLQHINSSMVTVNKLLMEHTPPL